jgi:hypothetical protein
MCDYSLEHVASRAAIVADRLVTARFPGTITRGFAGVDDPKVAVCVRPGTELAFDLPPKYERPWIFWPRKASGTVARFRQVNPGLDYLHHDALEFADGTLVPLAHLRPGQYATVLQLPRELTKVTTSGHVSANDVAATPEHSVAD